MCTRNMSICHPLWSHILCMCTFISARQCIHCICWCLKMHMFTFIFLLAVGEAMPECVKSVCSSTSNLLSVCTKSTVVGAPSTSLGQLMFDSLAFLMQQLWQREQRLVSWHPVCVYVLSFTFRICLVTCLSLNTLDSPGFLLWQL
jgi:hypothetical protein